MYNKTGARMLLITAINNNNNYQMEVWSFEQ